MTDLSDLGRRLVDDPPVAPTARADLERRWRRRSRRRMAAAAAMVVAAGSVVAGVVATTGGTAARVQVASPPELPVGAVATPVRPTAMAVGPSGNLFIADLARDQILERLPDGRFVIVAGTGRKGFSGDGGPAIHARLDDPSGMAFASDGTLYFADRSNHRVRAIAPDGTITTVAGDGNSTGFVTAGTPALDASFDPTDVAIGPHGQLYIATGEQVLRLADHTLIPVVGSPNAPAGLYGIGGPATAASADGANGIAFDSTGNLYITGSNTKTLLMVTPSGNLSELPGINAIYPRGDGGLATSPDGTVIAMDTQKVLSLSAHGVRTITSLNPAGSRAILDGVRGFSPDGIAVGPHGTIYLDTYQGNGYADRSAIAALSPDGTTSRLLWESPPPVQPTTTTPPGTASTSNTAVILRGSGLSGVAFGTSQPTAITDLGQLLGPPSSTAPLNQCGVDTAVQWPTLTAYFAKDAFVGYSTLAANGTTLPDGNQATTTGLRVGDSLSQAERIYGPALTTSFAQGGSWAATTPTGRIEGYLTSEPNQNPPARIASIEAGSLGCPAAHP